MNNFIIACSNHNQQVREKNLMQSEMVKENHFALINDFHNMPKSYNWFLDHLIVADQSIDKVMFCHEDVYLTPQFEEQISEAIDLLPIDWAVCGVAGVTFTGGKRVLHGYIQDRDSVWGQPIKKPVEVQTVDELLIIVNTEWDLRFNEQFPLDFYAADLCMQAHQKGLGVYVIPGFVHHNSTRGFGQRTPSFFESEKKYAKKWKHLVPDIGALCTTCCIIK